MSNARTIRRILAVATLAAGMGLLGTGPAAAGQCKLGEQAVPSPVNGHSICDLNLDLPAGDTGAVNRSLTEQMMRSTSVRGLGPAAPLLSTADVAGMAAATGARALPGVTLPDPPKVSEIKRSDIEAHRLPALSKLPELPSTQVDRAVTGIADMADATRALSGRRQLSAVRGEAAGRPEPITRPQVPAQRRPLPLPLPTDVYSDAVGGVLPNVR